MSKLIDNYLEQEKAKKQTLKQFEYACLISYLNEFADKMDNEKIVHYPDIIEKLMYYGYTPDISEFHDIALARKTHYVFDKTYKLLALADETDLKKNKVYNIIAKVQTYMSCITFLYLIAVLYAGINGMMYEVDDTIKAFLIFISASTATSLLIVLNNEYHQKYELYGVIDKQNKQRKR